MLEEHCDEEMGLSALSLLPLVSDCGLQEVLDMHSFVKYAYFLN